MIWTQLKETKFFLPKKFFSENCKTKSLLNFNVDYKQYCLKIRTSIYKNLETLHFTTDFVSNLF